MGKMILRTLAVAALLDGLLTMSLGRKYLCALRVGPPGNPFRRAVEWFLRWPGWALRGGAALQAMTGAGMLVRRAPAQRVILED